MRLTKRDSGGNALMDCKDCEIKFRESCCSKQLCLNALIGKLAAYEDAEEQGRLVRLPLDMKGIKLVVAERERQIDLWGDQSGNHPFEWMAILGEEYGELCEAVNETCFQNPKHPERGGKPNIVKEAVHVAAVAIAIAEAALKRGQDDGV